MTKDDTGTGIRFHNPNIGSAETITKAPDIVSMASKSEN
jgi:hypothetical protein